MVGWLGCFCFGVWRGKGLEGVRTKEREREKRFKKKNSKKSFKKEISPWCVSIAAKSFRFTSQCSSMNSDAR